MVGGVKPFVLCFVVVFANVVSCTKTVHCYSKATYPNRLTLTTHGATPPSLPSGLNAEGSHVSIYDSLFDGNSNRFEGGALGAEANAVVTLEKTTFINNFVDIQGYDPGSGGAVVVARST